MTTWISLLRSLPLAFALGAMLTGTASAETPLAGTWQGRLEIAAGRTLTIHFEITAKPGGGYSGIVTSPDDGAIKNVPASSVRYEKDKLTIDVPDLAGGYAGTLRNGAFEGEWSQEGSKLPLSLRPYKKSELTRADVEVLRGEWFGKLATPAGAVTIVLHLGAEGDRLRGTLDVPEQGVKDWEASNPLLDDGHFSIELPRARARISGTLKGNEIAAEWNQLGNSLPFTLKKGKYVAVLHYLDLPAVAREQLKGRWSGTLNGLAVAVRFEPDAQGRMLGWFDSTQQGLLNIAITSATLTGKALTFALDFGGKFTGEVADGKMNGEWSQTGLPKPLPLVLTRER